MNIVLDTNVLISGFSGPPARILAVWSDGRLELLASVEILIEYRRVSEHLHDHFPTVEFRAVLDLITQGDTYRRAGRARFEPCRLRRGKPRSSNEIDLPSLDGGSLESAPRESTRGPGEHEHSPWPSKHAS